MATALATAGAHRVSSPATSHRPRKRLGQHFLRDAAVVERIVASIAPAPGQHLVEIGPGLGALTLPLLKAAGRLEVVELDRDLLPHLKNRCAGHGDLVVHCADALRFELCALAAPGARLRLAGNLPYNITSPLLFHLLDQARCIADMHFMLQREVVERMVATPGSGAYGRLSVMLQYRCHMEPLFTVAASAFRPPPRVESAVVRLIPHARAPVTVTDPAKLEHVVRQAFAQRRKTLRNSLKGLVEEHRIRDVGIDPQLRPEALSLAQFALLAELATR